MGDTFGGRTWTRPTNTTTGRSQGEIRERAYNDQQRDADGCSLFLLLALAAVAALLGVVLG